MSETYKSARGRPANPVKKDDWHVSIDQEISVYFRLKYTDPFTNRIKVGGLSELVNRLLREEYNRDRAASTPNGKGKQNG